VGWGRALLLAVLLPLGCTTQLDEEAAPFRDLSAPIASQVDVTASDLSGGWGVVAGAGGVTAGTRLAFLPGPNEALALQRDGISPTALIAQGNGRWRLERPVAGLPAGAFWVLWMDADARTAAVGRPDGAFGWIMERPGKGGADRRAAARDILTWFGYDPTRLEEVVE
jgi:apolipoprotein D and lipocalin family protein